MRTLSKGLWKFIKWLLLIIIGLYIILIIIASPLTKYLVQKYDLQYTGREITLDRAFVNPLGGSTSLHNLQMREAQSDSIFFSAEKLSADLSLLKALRGIYQVNYIRLVKPEINIFRTDTIFNFNDLIEKFAVKKDSVEKEAVKFSVLDIKLEDGLVRYGEKAIDNITEISQVNFSSPGMKWNVDSLQGEFSFVPGAGSASGNFVLNTDSLDYRGNIEINGFDLAMFNQYFVKYAGKANLTGIINTNLSMQGKFKNFLEGKGSGKFELKDFHFGKDKDNDYASLERFLVEIRELDLKKSIYYFDSILVSKPSILYQMYDTLDNFRRLIPPKVKEKAEEATDTVDYLVNIMGADYYVKSFALIDGRIEFNDYSIAEKFTFIMDKFNIKADTIDKQKRKVKIETTGKIYPAGNISSTLSMDTKNENNFDISYEMRNVPATMFNPYLITYTSYPLDRGTIEMHGTWNVRNRNISSLNHFLVIDPRDTKKVRGKNTKWVPLPLIMAFVRERGGVIDYQIPVKGSLDDPAFKLKDVISDILRNILEKPPTTPYRMEVRNVEKKVEKTLTVKWKMRQVRIEKEQGKFLENISKFLKKNPEAHIVIEPIVHVEKEMENLLLFEAKKSYFFETNGKKESALSEKDSMKVEKLSSKDPAFIKHMNSKMKNSDLLTLQEKCYNYIGKQIVKKRFDETVITRKNEFMKFFVKDKTDNRVEFTEMKNTVPYNWFSYYNINYKGDIPESLKEAFNKLYELDVDPAREEFFSRRNK